MHDDSLNLVPLRRLNRLRLAEAGTTRDIVREANLIVVSSEVELRSRRRPGCIDAPRSPGYALVRGPAGLAVVTGGEFDVC